MALATLGISKLVPNVGMCPWGVSLRQEVAFFLTGDSTHVKKKSLLLNVGIHPKGPNCPNSTQCICVSNRNYGSRYILDI